MDESTQPTAAARRAVAGEIPGLTPLRGVAALMVVFFHLHVFFPALHVARYTKLFSNGYLWVDFFFVLSGFVLHHVYAGWFTEGVRKPRLRRFLGLRLARIYPVHLAMLALLLLAECLYAVLSADGAVVYGRGTFTEAPFEGRNSLWALVTNLALVQSWGVHTRDTWNLPAWSISVEWALYLVFPFVVGFAARAGDAVRAILVAGIFGGYALLISWNGDLDLTHDLGLVRGALGFGLGLLIYPIDRRPDIGRWLSHDLLAAAALVVLVWVLHTSQNAVFLMASFVILIGATTHNRGVWIRMLATRPVVWLGEVSYALYMIHVVLLILVVRLWNCTQPRAFGLSFGPAECVVAIVALLSAMLVAAEVLHRTVEQPARRAWRARLSGSAD